MAQRKREVSTGGGLGLGLGYGEVRGRKAKGSSFASRSALDDGETLR